MGPVRELLRSGRQPISSLLIERGRAERSKADRSKADRSKADRSGRIDGAGELEAQARDKGIRVDYAEARELEQMCGPGAVHQGVVATAGPFQYEAIEDLLPALSGREQPALLVAIDGVTDPHNLGAIARSAYLLGADGLLLPRDRAAEVTAVATKSSAGATEHLAICQVTNLARALGEVKDAGLWNAALAAGPEARPIGELDATLPLCVVVGSEGRGLRQLVARQCDYHIEIPMAAEAIGSFNVSVATAIALYDIGRRR